MVDTAPRPGSVVLIGTLLLALPSWASAADPLRLPTRILSPRAPAAVPAGSPTTRARNASPLAPADERPGPHQWPALLCREAERHHLRRQARRPGPVPLADLGRMAAQLKLRLEPTDLGDGSPAMARVAFWAATNRAVLDAIEGRDLLGLARLYGAQSAVLRAEGRLITRLVIDATRADLAGVHTGRVAIIARDCDVCARDHGMTVAIPEERQVRRLPHAECRRGPCTCVYTHAVLHDQGHAAVDWKGEAAYRRMWRHLRSILIDPVGDIAASARLRPSLRQTAARQLIERQERHLVDGTSRGPTQAERIEQSRAVLDAIGVLDRLIGLAGSEDLTIADRRRAVRLTIGDDVGQPRGPSRAG